MDYFTGKLYRCFNQDLKWYLLNNGYHFLLIADDCKSRDRFWLFERSESFNKDLELYFEKKKGKVKLSSGKSGKEEFL